MPRRRQQSSLDDTFNLLKLAPLWVGPALALLLFILFRFLVPLLIPAKQHGVDSGLLFRPLLSMLAWFALCAVLVAWLMAEGWKLINRRLLNSQTGLASIQDISWRDFERLVSEAYRRQGYLAEVIGNGSGDGGVDIKLTGHGETALVQCKQWKAYRVGVTTVRELLGVVISEKANRGILVTSGRFTQEARAFAARNPNIQLVDGSQLAELIRNVQAAPTIAPMPLSPPSSPSPDCPFCSAGMVLRMARKGPNAGSQFWGCVNYPWCRATRPAEAMGQPADS